MVYQQVRRARGYLDSLCMDGAEVAVNCACNVRSCPTCWCPDDDLARTDKTYKYRRVEEVLSKLDAALDELLDAEDDTLPGCAKDVNAAEKRIRHRLLPRNAWMLSLVILVYHRISWDIPLANDTAPGLLHDSPALPVQPG